MYRDNFQTSRGSSIGQNKAKANLHGFLPHNQPHIVCHQNKHHHIQTGPSRCL